jgi:hypothetical protein
VKIIGRWVVYERQETEFIHLSKPFRTKEQAEKERIRLKARPEYRKSANPQLSMGARRPGGGPGSVTGLHKAKIAKRTSTSLLDRDT